VVCCGLSAPAMWSAVEMWWYGVYRVGRRKRLLAVFPVKSLAEAHRNNLAPVVPLSKTVVMPWRPWWTATA